MSERKYLRKRPRRDTGPPVVEDAKSGSDYDIIAYAIEVLRAIFSIRDVAVGYNGVVPLWVSQEIVYWLAAPEMIEIYLVTLGQGYYSALKALTADTIARFPDAVIHLAQRGHENMKLVGPYKMTVLATLLENMRQHRATQIENKKVALENALRRDVASMVYEYLGPDGQYRADTVPGVPTPTHRDSRFGKCSANRTTAKQVVENVDLRQLSKYESFRNFLLDDLLTTFFSLREDKDVKGLRVRLNTTTCATHEDLWQTMLALSPLIYYKGKYF